MKTAKLGRAAVYLSLLWCAMSALPCCRAQAAGREIHVLAAADLQSVLPALAGQFEQTRGIKLIVSYGSSATLATQILNGDPADLFLSADYSFPESIVAAHLADSPAPIAYARGVLVLWARKDSPLQPLTQNTLRDGKFATLAIANPEHAPYGRAADLADHGFDGALPAAWLVCADSAHRLPGDTAVRGGAAEVSASRGCA
jgi:molybdate transport system substrate-binding protein